MARSIDEIQQEIKVTIRTYPSLDQFLFPEDGGSSVSVFNLLIYIVSLAMFTFEAIIDNLSTEIGNKSQEVPVGNPQWVRKQMLLFQYGDIIQLSDEFIPYYAVIDPSKRIVTHCSVSEEFSSEIKIKVAKTVGSTPQELDGPEIAALEDYYFGNADQQGIGFAGVRADFITQAPDRMAITGIVYYSGQFVESTVKQNVIDTINDYFANLNFDGVVVMNQVVTDVEEVAGVTNFQISNVVGRAWDVPLNSGTSVPINGTYQTEAGYVIEEDTLGATLINTLTMSQI